MEHAISKAYLAIMMTKILSLEFFVQKTKNVLIRNVMFIVCQTAKSMKIVLLINLKIVLSALINLVYNRLLVFQNAD